LGIAGASTIGRIRAPLRLSMFSPPFCPFPVSLPVFRKRVYSTATKFLTARVRNQACPQDDLTLSFPVVGPPFCFFFFFFFRPRGCELRGLRCSSRYFFFLEPQDFPSAAFCIDRMFTFYRGPNGCQGPASAPTTMSCRDTRVRHFSLTFSSLQWAFLDHNRPSESDTDPTRAGASRPHHVTHFLRWTLFHMSLPLVEGFPPITRGWGSDWNKLEKVLTV